MQTNCNEVVVLQQGEHSSVNNRPAEGVTGTRKKGVTEILEKMKRRMGSEGAVQKRTFNYFPWPRLKSFLCDGHTNRLIGLCMFQNLLSCMGRPG